MLALIINLLIGEKMKQKQREKFIRLYKEFSDDTCWERAEKSAKHLLVAVAFKESSKLCYNKTNSVLLPPIGYYYSMFHFSLCLCWLHPEIPDDKLSRLRHSSLQNLISSFFINQHILDKHFLELINELKEEREWLNYRFGEFDYDLFLQTEKNEKLIREEFNNGFRLLNEICEILYHKFDIKQRIRTYIADSKGDDLLQTYLNREEQEIVMDYINENGFSN